jgi:hypothetical protein
MGCGSIWSASSRAGWWSARERGRRGRPRSRGVRGIENTGREIGRELAPAGPDRSVESLETTLTALGFQHAFVPHDPDEAGCVIDVRRSAAPTSA